MKAIDYLKLCGAMKEEIKKWKLFGKQHHLMDKDVGECFPKVFLYGPILP
jgi:hypothetical protein